MTKYFLMVLCLLFLLIQINAFAEEFLKPSSIAIDSGNNIYTRVGNSIYKFNKKGYSPSIINKKINDIFGTKDNEGRIFIDTTIYIDGKDMGGIKKITEKEIRYFSQHFKCEPVLEEMIERVVYPEHITMGPDGNIYVVGRDIFRKSYKLAVLDSNDGRPIAVFNVGGKGEKELYNPQGIASDQDGNFYITNYWDNKVKIFDKDGKFIKSFGEFGSKNGQFKAIQRIAIDHKNGFIYVTDSYFPTMFRGVPGEPAQMRVQKFDMEGKLIKKWGDKKFKGFKLLPPGIVYEYLMDEPEGIAVDSKGNVFVVCHSGEVFKFNGEGKILKKWGGGWKKKGSGKGEFDYPRDIAIDSDDNVYIADTDNNRIQKFDNDGKFLMEIK